MKSSLEALFGVGCLLSLFGIVSSPAIAQSSAPTQEQRSGKLGAQGAASKEAQLETYNRRLIEINSALNELDRKSEEITAKRGALQTERSSVVIAISRVEQELEFQNSPGYLVIGFPDAIVVKLLMHG